MVRPHIEHSLADAEASPYWLDRAERPDPRMPLDGPIDCDLAIVGAGYSGLWTALLAKERNPDREVAVFDAGQVGHAASGRNGGFCAASLTHGEANGRDRWPDEYNKLAGLGQANLDGFEASLIRHQINCGFARTGELTVATEPYQVDELRNGAALDPALTFLDRDAIRSEVHSPTYHAATLDPTTALVDPAQLAWGLAEACERLGVRIYEDTPVDKIASQGSSMVLTTKTAAVTARHVALGTNAYPSLVRRTRLHTVPVYDYVLMTEPLSPGQLADIGWTNRQAIGDSANRFHYYRRTADDRILWGGYDAVYNFGGRVSPRYDQRPATFATLAEHFFETFPQLEGLRFTHQWGGAIDTCTRFCAYFGTAHKGRVAYAAGFTGLGVGATRFGADVMLDLLEGVETDRTSLEMVRTMPIAFPPEPFAWVGINATRWSLARADANQGRRNLWLRTLDRLGLGFDS